MSERRSTKGTWHFRVLDGDCQVRVPGLPRFLDFCPGGTKSAAVSATPPFRYPPLWALLLPLVLGFLRVASPIIESEVSKKESAEHNDGNGGVFFLWGELKLRGNSGVSVGQLPARSVNLMTGIHGHFPFVTSQKLDWPRLLCALSFVIYHNFGRPCHQKLFQLSNGKFSGNKSQTFTIGWQLLFMASAEEENKF